MTIHVIEVEIPENMSVVLAIKIITEVFKVSGGDADSVASTMSAVADPKSPTIIRVRFEAKYLAVVDTIFDRLQGAATAMKHMAMEGY